MPRDRRPWHRARYEPYPAWTALDGVDHGASRRSRATIAARSFHRNRLSATPIPVARFLEELSAEPLFKRFQNCERPRTVIGSLDRGKFSTRLARIGIDPKQQEFDRDRTEIDLALDQRLGRFIALILRKGIHGRCEKNFDRLIEIVFERIECHHAGLSDPGL